MHLFNFENEEDEKPIIPISENLFCEMARLSTSSYIEKWKSFQNKKMSKR